MDSSTDLNTHDHPTALLSVAGTDTVGSKLPLYKSLGTPQPLSLNEFLARPINLYTADGAGAITTVVIYQFARDFFNQPSIAEKLKFFKYVRGTFVINVILTTAPYAAGQFVMAHFMGPFASNNVPFIDDDLASYSFANKTNVILDCATCNSATLKIPMHLQLPYADVSVSNDPFVNDMYIGLASLTNIVNTLDGTDSDYHLKIYVSLEDSEIAVPVVHDTRSIYTMSETLAPKPDKSKSEVQKTTSGPISYAATMISGFAKKLKDVPVIGKFAYATHMISNTVSDVATLFGYSRPKDLSAPNYPHEETYADYIGNVRVKTFTLDPQQEIPLDASFLGEEGDNLTFANTICRYGLLTRYPWDTSMASKTELFAMPITPSWCPSMIDQVYCPTPLAYCSQLFNFWRGTIVYKFVIPANDRVRGKIRIFWSPTVLDVEDQYQLITQNAPSVVIDLSSNTEVELKVPWGHRAPYLPSFILSRPEYVSTGQINGYLYGMVEEELVAQAPMLILTILVWVKADDDFQFHVPNQQRLQYLRRQLWNDDFDASNTVFQNDPWTAISPPLIVRSPTELPADSDYYNFTSLEVLSTNDNLDDAESMICHENNYNWSSKSIWKYGYGDDELVPNEIEESYEFTMMQSDNATLLQETQTLLPSTTSTDVTMLQMGEISLSFRNFLQRFYPSQWFPSLNTNGSLYTRRFIPYLPLEPLIYADEEGAIVMRPVIMTPLRYLCNMFYGVRGPTRFRLDNVTPGLRYLTHRAIDYPFNNSYVSSGGSFGIPYIFEKVKASTGEAEFFSDNGEPYMAEIPWQMTKSLYLTQLPSTPAYPAKLYGAYHIAYGNETVRNTVYQSIGEGFNPVVWNGTPYLTVFNPGTSAG